jgi:hypothetical protein
MAALLERESSHAGGGARRKAQGARRKAQGARRKLYDRRLEILYETRTRSFERHGKDSLAELEVLGMIRGGEACERMNRGQAGVSRRRCIVTILLEVSQERDDGVGREIAEVELHNVTIA